MLFRKERQLDKQLQSCYAALKICGYDEAGKAEPTEPEAKARLIRFLECLERSEPDTAYRDTLQGGETFHYGYVRYLFAMKGCLMRNELPEALRYAEDLTGILGRALFQKRVMDGVIMTLRPYAKTWRNKSASEGSTTDSPMLSAADFGQVVRRVKRELEDLPEAEQKAAFLEYAIEVIERDRLAPGYTAGKDCRLDILSELFRMRYDLLLAAGSV